MDLSKYMGIFREESERNLKQLNDSLLALEQNPENKEHLNIIFRLAHTFKGMAATMGFREIVELTHEMENLIERLRTQQLKLDESLIDVLFECLDTLEDLVENACKNRGFKPGSGKAGEGDKSKTPRDLSEVLKALRAINTATSANTPTTKAADIGTQTPKTAPKTTTATTTKAEEACPEEKDSEGAPLYPEIKGEIPEIKEIEFSEKERAEIKEAEKERARVMLAHVVLEDTCFLKAARSALVIRKIAESGDIIKVIPGIDELEDENFGLDFEVVFSTKKDEGAIKKEICKTSEIKDVTLRNLSSEFGSELKAELKTESGSELKTEFGSELKAELNTELGSELSSGKAISGQENDSEESSENSSQEELEPKKIDGEALKDEKGKTKKGETEKGETEKGETGEKSPVLSKSNPKIKNIQSVRVSTEQLDKLMNLAGELVINRSRINKLTEDLKSKELEEALSELRKLTREMQEEVLEARMVPLDHVFNIFPRMVRDLAKSENKKIDFIIRGKEIKLDRTVLDEIGDPVVHLLRNAVDHGIEKPEKRLELGKKESGTIILTASRQENYVLIKIEDDGQGIDTEELRKAAVEKGLISTEEAEQLQNRETMQLIFAHGLSTAGRVTDVSGRGVGMDVAKNRIESLGGSIKVESKPGIGTRLELKLPLTIALYQAMLVEVGDEKYAIPFTNIVKNVEVKKENIRHINGEEIILENEKVLPLLRLRRLFQLPVQDRDKLPVVVTEKAGQVIGIVVDRLLGKQEVIIKTFKSKLLENTGGFAGATILGDGNVVLILDINTLV